MAVEQIVDIPVQQEQVEIVQVPKIVEQRLVAAHEHGCGHQFVVAACTHGFAGKGLS